MCKFLMTEKLDYVGAFYSVCGQKSIWGHAKI